MRRSARRPGLRAVTGWPRVGVRDRSRRVGFGPAARRALVRSDAQRFLIGASRELASHLDPDGTAQRAARLAVPYLACLCTIDLIEDDGTIRRAGAAHADPVLLQEPGSRPLDPRDDDPIAALLRPRGATPFAAADEAGRAVALDGSRSATLGWLGCAWGIGVPLFDGERRLGVMILARARAARAPRPADLAVADAFGQSVALALTNARLRQIADQAIRTRDELLAMAIHELRGPAARIALRADLLRADLLSRSDDHGEDPASSRPAEGLARIAAAAMKMGRTIDELEEAVTLQPGQRPELTWQPVDLVAAARRAAASHAVDADRPIDFHADQDELIGSWNPGRIDRVLDNLIGNAVKYSPDQCGVSVAVGLESDDRGRWATLTVRDRGFGIAEDELPHVFDWSRRGRNVSDRVPGSGLGLAIVRQIVAQHGGTIAASSRIDEGSTFVVRLPLDGAQRPDGSATDPPAPASDRSVGLVEGLGPASPVG